MGTNNKKQMAGLFMRSKNFSYPRGGDIHPCLPSLPMPLVMVTFHL